MANNVPVIAASGGAIARQEGFDKPVLLADFNDQTLQAVVGDISCASYSVSIGESDEIAVAAS